MTMRRLYVLLRALPSTALLWQELQAAHEKAQIPTADRIRERQRFYDEQRKSVATTQGDADSGDTAADQQHDWQRQGV